MIAHYLKVAVRNLLKYKTQTFISIIGLAVGFVCFALSAYWIHYEMNYDSFHRDADRIYWVSANSRLGLPYPIGNYWHKNYVEIEDYAVFEIYGQGLYFNKKRSETYYAFADSSFMEMMDIRILEGNANFMTSENQEVAITEEKAKELFGNESPIGQEVTLGNQKHSICAVVNGWGKHTNIPYEFMGNLRYSKEWSHGLFKVLIKVRPGMNVKELERKMNVDIPDGMREFNKSTIPTFRLIPFTKVRYAEDSPFRKASTIAFNYILYFSITGLLIIVCALTNYGSVFINRIRIRRKELMLRKVNGASKYSLVALLTIEFVCLLLVAVFLGFVMIEIIFPWFCRYAQIETIRSNVYQESALYALLITIVSSVIIGSIILFMQRFSIPQYLVERQSRRKERILRKGSVILQLIISLSFIVCTVIVNKQLHYLRNSDLGMTHQNIGSLGIWSGVDMNVWKQKLEALPMVTEVLPPKYFPLTTMHDMAFIAKWDGSEGTPDKAITLELIPAGKKFFELYEMELLVGEWITEKSSITDIAITETTARRFGWNPQEAIGKRVYAGENYSMVVTGIVKDCAYYSPSVRPPETAFYNTEKQKHAWHRASLLFKFQEGTWDECRKMIEEMYEKECPEKSLSLKSEEEEYNKYLHSENMLTTLLEASSLVCVLISVFGIYSLVTLTCEQRRKEIAIRKVNGATVGDILKIFSKEYVLLLLSSALVAFPVSYVVMKKWIETYNRQTDIDLGIFVGIWMGVAFIIALSIGHRVWKASNENPAVVIKSE